MQGVAHHKLREDREILLVLSMLTLKKDAAVADVLHGPAAVGGEEGEGEVGGVGERAGGGRGGVRREAGMKAVAVEDAEEGRGVEEAEAAAESPIITKSWWKFWKTACA